MYEDITYSGILNRMLDRVSDELDKREGSIIMTVLAPCAMEIFLSYRELDRILLESYADTQSREYLILRAAERGVFPKEATPSVILCQLDVDAELGYRFSVSEYSFVITKDYGSGLCEMTCEQMGSCSNQVYGTVLSLQYIEGLNKIDFMGHLYYGEDEEDTEVFRQRYFDFLAAQAFGGNIADYTEKALQINGVNAVKVVPNYDGNGVVKLYIISSGGVADSDLVSFVQNAFDPGENGDGSGLAPIGHSVSVSSVSTQNVDIKLNVSHNGVNSYIQAEIENVIDDYFGELISLWGSTENIILRVSQIEAKILEISGVTDVWNTEINDENRVLSLGAYTIPIRGDVDATFS